MSTPPAAALHDDRTGHWFKDRVDGLLAQVGDTPMVRLERITAHLPPTVQVWGKCEWFNPGGSVKDRAALSMVLDAEDRGILRAGQTILDASSGNTGIAYAMIAAARGYKLALCLPTNASAERKAMLRAYGAEIIETSPLEGSDGAIRKARELVAADPDAYVYLNQYDNDANWQAHFHTTGPEIWRDTDGGVTHWVSTLGTSGTFMGTSRYLKSRNADVHCLAVQPDSPFHGLEGLKHMESAIVPGIYDADLADEHMGAPTEAAIEMTRRLAREEGLLAGVSSGAAVWSALRVAERLDAGVVVTLLCDGGERYLSDGHVFGQPPRRDR